MRWIGLAHGFAQVRSFSSAPKKDFSRVAAVSKLWEKFNIRHTILTSDKEFEMRLSRDNTTSKDYSHLRLQEGCSGVIIIPERFIGLKKADWYIKGYLRNAFVRGVGLHAVKEEFLSNCKAVYFEILRSIRDGNFSNLTEYTLGGNETLQFHRSAAHKLTSSQKDILSMTEDDFLGDGYLRKYPWLRDEMGPYIHSIDFVNVDAVGNTHPGEDKESKVFCRYKVVIGGIYKFEMLRKEVQGAREMWNQKVKTPKNYGFKWPRYTFVELDFCQVAKSTMPIQLEDTRYLYDFHVISY